MSGILLAAVITIVSLVVFNIGGIRQARAASIESIVILPFSNYTGTDTLDPYISGMHSLLINELGKIKGLRVISKVSSDSFKNTDKTIPQITKELNVDAAIELGILCFSDTICIQPRLMSGGTEEEQLWIGDYREAKGNLFNLYNQIIMQIAGEVRISLTPAEKARLAESRTIDREALDAYLREYSFWGDFSLERFNEIRDYLNNAIEKDPDWAPLYLALANYWIWLAQWGHEQPSVALPLASMHLNKALELDPLNPMIQILYTTSQLFIYWCSADRTQIEKQLADDPNNYGANVILNYLASYCGEYETAIKTEKILLQIIMGDQFDEEKWKDIETIFNEKGYEARDNTMPYLTTAYDFEPLYDNPRFKDMLKKMNLPLPESD